MGSPYYWKINLQEAKKNLRLQVIDRLSNLKDERKKNIDAVITERLNQYLDSRFLLSSNQSLTVGVFYPLSDEVYWPNGFKATKQLAFPEVVDQKMVFRQCGLESLVEIKQFGRKMRVPCQEHQIVKPDIIIVPGIAFDRSGNRLGRGGGFYDTYLSKFEGPKIAICNSLQLVDELPIEEHDIGVNVIITEEALIECPSSKEEK